MMDVAKAQEFLRSNHRAVMSTFRQDGRPALTPVTVAIDDQARVVISSRAGAIKVSHVRRDPRVSLVVMNDNFYGEFVQVEGTAEVIELPAAMPLLIDYYRAAAGEHPDWDDYRAAMQRDQRVIIRFTVERAGPNQSG